MDNKAMYKLSYGLFVLTAYEDGKDNGCIINTAVQMTSQPQRISITVNKANATHDMIMHTKKFTVSVISEKADFGLFRHFGFRSGKDVNKFADFGGYRRGFNGCAYITEGTNGYIAGWVEQSVDLGTHTLFIAMVTDMEVLSSVPSATYSYYQQNIKPKPEKEETKSGYRCTVCGYIYEGSELPADFICPLCKHPASDFEKLN